jgi:hypothetical protein
VVEQLRQPLSGHGFRSQGGGFVPRIWWTSETTSTTTIPYFPVAWMSIPDFVDTVNSHPLRGDCGAIVELNTAAAGSSRGVLGATRGRGCGGWRGVLRPHGDFGENLLAPGPAERARSRPMSVGSWCSIFRRSSSRVRPLVRTNETPGILAVHSSVSGSSQRRRDIRGECAWGPHRLSHAVDLTQRRRAPRSSARACRA